MFIREEECILCTGKFIMIRNRENARSASLRKPDTLPPQEIRTAILQIIERHHAVGERELVSTTSRAFGFKATGATLKQRVTEQLKKLMDEAKIKQENGVFKIPVA